MPGDGFQCSSASRKFLKPERRTARASIASVSVLFSEPKIPQIGSGRSRRKRLRVSVLFSEPKIPQKCQTPSVSARRASFSALQRAENSSNHAWSRRSSFACRFQCSSASRKFLKPAPRAGRILEAQFQCSSASRKFLKSTPPAGTNWRTRVSVLFSEPKIPQILLPYSPTPATRRFSALQRAENSSKVPNRQHARVALRFQCSSASRKFLKSRRTRCNDRAGRVSVLFSEPKIPQRGIALRDRPRPRGFQCSSASRKFLKPTPTPDNRNRTQVSVLFSEPKIPQTSHIFKRRNALPTFQCSSASRKFLKVLSPPSALRTKCGFSALQRAENSSNLLTPNPPPRSVPVSVLFSEPKIPQTNS